jgi:hypothetical protein
MVFWQQNRTAMRHLLQTCQSVFELTAVRRQKPCANLVIKNMAMVTLIMARLAPACVNTQVIDCGILTVRL